MYLCWSSLVDYCSYLSTLGLCYSLYVTLIGKSVFGDYVILCVTVIVMTSRLSLVYDSIWRHMFFFGLIYSIVVCSGLAFYPRDIGGTFSRTEISSLFSEFIFYEDIDLCCVFICWLPVCLHVVILYLRFIHTWDYLLN